MDIYKYNTSHFLTIVTITPEIGAAGICRYIDAGAYSTQQAAVKITVAGGFEANWNILVGSISSLISI